MTFLSKSILIGMLSTTLECKEEENYERIHTHAIEQQRVHG